MGRLETVTVWAENPQVLQAVIGANAIDMIELEGKAAIGRALGPAAEFTPGGLQPSPEKALLQAPTIVMAIGNEDRFEW